MAEECPELRKAGCGSPTVLKCVLSLAVGRTFAKTRCLAPSQDHRRGLVGPVWMMVWRMKDYYRRHICSEALSVLCCDLGFGIGLFVILQTYDVS